MSPSLIPISTVGRFSLNNSGSFLVKIFFTYTTSGSKPAYSTKSKILLSGQSLLLSPACLGVPDLSSVTLNVDIIIQASDVVATQTFTFDPETAMCAYYTIAGSLFSQTLTLDRTDPPIWRNWSENILYRPPDHTYFYPHTANDLVDVIQTARSNNMRVRVSGQRHSQTPLVAYNTRDAQPENPTVLLVDMACYRDLGDGTKGIIMHPNDNGLVIVNAGIREDELDAFLTANNKILRTATAGGFFSVGGMTCVDVHGGTVDEPIFSENVTEFTFMGPDANTFVVNKDTNVPHGMGAFTPLQCAHVNLGALGVVTRVTLSVMDRPFADSLVPDRETFWMRNKTEFAQEMSRLVSTQQRVETFFNPYNGEANALMWTVTNEGCTPNEKNEVGGACEDADRQIYGAPDQGAIEGVSQELLMKLQDGRVSLFASEFIDVEINAIKKMYQDSVEANTDLWLTKATKCMFMSYFVPLPGPGITNEGLEFAWTGIKAVMDRLKKENEFLLAAPLEFRFVAAGDSIMAGTYTAPESKTTHYINLDMIGFVDPVESKEYPQNLQKFFRDIEKVWFTTMGGLPHNGKMYGFLDPENPNGTPDGAYHPNFMNKLAGMRKDRLAAFDTYRNICDPKGMFCNDYISSLLDGVKLQSAKQNSGPCSVM